MLHIRPATVSDLAFIVAGNLQLAQETESIELDRQTLTAGVLAFLNGSAPGRYWVAEHDGVLVGQVAITFEWRNRMVWWIQSVFVTGEARRLGVFRALYNQVREEALAAGAAGLRLYVDTRNRRAQDVYAALGMNGDHYRVFEQMFPQ